MEDSVKGWIKTAVKAFVVGSTMMVPGVSGGSMAMILGEYDRLISSVPGIFSRKTFKASVIYLALFCIAAIIGMFLIARPLEFLIDRYENIILYFFTGAVAGTVPMMFRKAQRESFSLVSFLFIAIGIAMVFCVGLIPENVFAPSLSGGLGSMMLQVVGGIIVAVGLVLPGISVSYLLVVLGLYDKIIIAMSNLDILPLIPLAIGGAIGILGLTKILEIAMKRYPRVTYMIILGFLLGSIMQVFPGFPSGWMILVSIPVFLLGFVAIYFLSRTEE